MLDSIVLTKLTQSALQNLSAGNNIDNALFKNQGLHKC